MTIQIMCSNCGHRSRTFRYDQYSRIEPADEYVKAGWNSFGSAFYCPKCVKTWEKRNGKNRPLWGATNTRERVFQKMICECMDRIDYLETGEVAT